MADRLPISASEMTLSRLLDHGWIESRGEKTHPGGAQGDAVAHMKPSASTRGSGAEGEAVSNANDNKSPLIHLLTCIVCKVTMKLEKSSPDAEGSDLVQYRCELCGRNELVRLLRRSRDAAA